ncbi:MAG: hypothetical protein QW794_03155 [Thermosphaera sp.]
MGTELTKLIENEIKEFEREIKSIVEASGIYTARVEDIDISEIGLRTLLITIYTKMMEPSEECASVPNYDECLEEVLNEINKNYSFKTEIRIKTEEFTLETWGLKCEKDYCEVGAAIGVAISNPHDLSTIKLAEETVKKVIDILFTTY